MASLSITKTPTTDSYLKLRLARLKQLEDNTSYIYLDKMAS